MTPARNPQKLLFVRQHVLPVLLVFLIPGFSAWFFPYAEKITDQSVFLSLEREIEDDANLPAERKEKVIEFYRRVPVSRIMASDDPKLVRQQATFESLKSRYAVFRWMTRLAWVCLGTIALTFLIVGLSVWYSLRSHAAQYHALRVGWPVLQASAAIQVLGQAILATLLSFWVTALFMQVYSAKLIGIVGVLAAGAVLALWKAIFAKVDDRFGVAGELVTAEQAPRLWANIRDLAGRLGTAAPDQVVVGIDPSFFVTEHPVILHGQSYPGRTLFLSLPLLKILSTDEADAILGHELAHFSGEDTLWGRKIAPLLGRFQLHLSALFQGISAGVGHFMLLFWKLYQLSIRRLSRAREFRADAVGAALVSKEASKRALVKITSYCEYRAGTENAIIQQQRVDPTLDLADRLESGYPAFLASFATSSEAVNERVPHPFDTHPTLHNRLAELGFEAHEALLDTQLQQPVADSWYTDISTAPELEGRMWGERQERLKAFHAEQLAWRLLPANEEEKRLVLARFPRAVFRDKKGREASVDFDRWQMPDWAEPILFKHIISLQVKNSWVGELLTIKHHTADSPKQIRTRCKPGRFRGERGNLLAVFNRYYSRHKTAEAHHLEARSACAPQASRLLPEVHR